MSNDDEICYRHRFTREQPQWLRLMPFFWAVSCAGVAVLNFLRGSALGYAYLGIAVISGLVFAMLATQTTVVDSDGVRLSRWARMTPWEKVESVQRPGRFDDVVKVTLRSGKSVSTGLPVGYAEQVARIGGKPLVDQASTLGQK